jgi:CheY-like chemotaxis protein
MVDKTAIFSAENRVDIPVYPLDVFTLTEAGTAQIQGGGTRLPSEALEALVILDGKKTVGDLEQQLASLPAERVRDLVRALLAAGFVRAVTMAESGDIDVDFDAFFNAAAGGDATPSAGTQASAAREAESGAPSLDRKGYYVSIARQALKPRSAAGAKHVALIIEDDPDVSALVKRLLERAQFGVKVAATRDEVLARLREQPMPDLVILDVILPGVNGFDVLQRLKSHPMLKAVPVVMLTAEASREAVVRGLATGADGYITKPFDNESLLRGVRAVLGIAQP